MLAVSAPRNTKDAKNVLREGRKSSGVVCLSFLLQWSLVIKQMMQAALIIVALVLTSPAGTTKEVEEGDSSLPVWRVTASQEAAPHFITVHQLVQAEPHQTAVLECAVANIDSALSSVTVSWLRWSDMSVLSVGGFVFSSDPRLRVLVTQLSPSAVSWSLSITPVQPGDSGDYQCQINTEPKLSLDVTLTVDGQLLPGAGF